jgi:UrcA family protein
MKTTALVTTLLIGCLAATAQASTPAKTEKVRQQVVSFSDLNLETKAGAETLLRRIKFAARRVCGVGESGLMAIDLHRCAKQATARAVADVDARTIVVADAR